VTAGDSLAGWLFLITVDSLLAFIHSFIHSVAHDNIGEEVVGEVGALDTPLDALLRAPGAVQAASLGPSFWRGRARGMEKATRAIL
jgi:hypothetical protein